MRPVILVSADRRDPTGAAPGPRVRPRRAECWVTEATVDAVRDAGGVPLVVPPGPTDLDALFAVAGGVVLTGGAFDIHPSWYGQEVQGRIDRVEPARTSLEMELARRCLASDVPVLGICGGHQLLAVAGGGTLIQDLPGPPRTLQHEQPTDPAEGWHTVRLGGGLAALLGATISANSTHHQAVDDPGVFLIEGRSEDGVVEALRHPTHPFAVGVQWHPELLGETAVYDALVSAIP